MNILQVERGDSLNKESDMCDKQRYETAASPFLLLKTTSGVNSLENLCTIMSDGEIKNIYLLATLCQTNFFFSRYNDRKIPKLPFVGLKEGFKSVLREHTYVVG